VRDEPRREQQRHDHERGLAVICEHAPTLERCEDRVENPVGSEPHRVVRDQPRFRLRARDRGARGVLGELARVQRDRRDPCLARRQRDPLVQLDELRQRQQRMAGIALDLRRPRLVAEDERVRR